MHVYSLFLRSPREYEPALHNQDQMARVSLWWPHLGFDILNVLLQPLDQLVYFQDLVLAVAEVVTVIPGRQLKLIILQDREVRTWAPTLWSLSALIPTVPRILSPDSLR